MFQQVLIVIPGLVLNGPGRDLMAELGTSMGQIYACHQEGFMTRFIKELQQGFQKGRCTLDKSLPRISGKILQRTIEDGNNGEILRFHDML